MRALKAILVAGAVLIAAPAAAETVLITAERLLDVLTGRMLEKPAIVVEDGRIRQIGSQLTLKIATDKRLDFPGLTLVPGFIDMHVHLSGDPRIPPGCDGIPGGPCGGDKQQPEGNDRPAAAGSHSDSESAPSEETCRLARMSFFSSSRARISCLSFECSFVSSPST